MSAQSQSFLDGWRTLPEELKIHILNLILAPDPSELHHGLLTYHGIREARFWNQYPFLGLAAPLLECTEINSLVLEAFYTQRTFLLDYGSTDQDRMHGVEHLFRPPGHIVAFIRKLKISFNRLSMVRLQLVEHIAVETKRLEQLVSVDLFIDSPLLMSQLGPNGAFGSKKEYNGYLSGMANVQFDCKCLRITCKGWNVNNHLYGPLLDKLDLDPTASPAGTAWTGLSKIIHSSGNDDKIQEVDFWPAEVGHLGCTRLTVKEVAIEEKYRLKPYTRYDRKYGLV
jgi:hypothetical protein